MKVTGVRTKSYEIELTRPLGDANDPSGCTHLAMMAVFLDTDEGLTGVALSGPGMEKTIKGMVDNLIVGRDPRGVRGLWKRMVDQVFKGNNRGPASGAISTIDIALWDLKAKANNEPLWKTLGASSRYVKGYASDIGLNLNDDELRAFYTRLAKQGINAGKIKVGLNQEDDLRRIGIMHDALALSGKTPLLMIDSNEYWSPKQAIRHIQAIEEQYELNWVEEPARRWDYRVLRKVSESVRAAVATGENLNDISEFMALIANEAVDVVQVGSGTSGITGALMVADMAYGFELPVSLMNCPANYMAQLGAALPNHNMIEVLDAGGDQGMIHGHTVEDGYVVLSDDPGLGLAFDEAKLAAWAIDKPSSRVTMPFARRRGAGLYEVPIGEPEHLPEE
ncbi:mandelate racemase/muconate lactonizing enzyme family protein [soil metagenome]